MRPFQSPIHRVIDCNDILLEIRPDLDVLHFSPLFTGSSTATRLSLNRWHDRGLQFQSPIHRVIDCNAPYPPRERRPSGNFSPLFTGSSTATRRRGDGWRWRGHRFQSPIHRVIDCNGHRHARPPTVRWHFSPLFTGSSTATSRQTGHQRARFFNFSPLFTGSSTATRRGLL